MQAASSGEPAYFLWYVQKKLSWLNAGPGGIKTLAEEAQVGLG